jgi:hypothetical protein
MASSTPLASPVNAQISGSSAKTTPVDADLAGLVDSADSSKLKKLTWANVKATLKAYFDTLYRPKSSPYYIEVALSTNGEDIESGTFKGFARVHTAGNITGLVIDCDPNNEPSASSVQVDLNTVDRSTGTATSVLSTVATIATSANTGTGTVDGTQAVSAGDLLSFDVDQGSDGQDLIATVEITPT